MKDAVCYTLNETRVRTGKKRAEFCRQLTVGIEAEKVELVKKKDLAAIVRRGRVPERRPETGASWMRLRGVPIR